jgi:hypothetical protein
LNQYYAEIIEKPSAPVRSELENYFREAKWKAEVSYIRDNVSHSFFVLKINIYRCECWGETIALYNACLHFH